MRGLPSDLLSLGGLVVLGEGRASPSLELALRALRLAQAFSLGGGAGTTLRGSASCLGGGAWLLGEGGSSSRPLNTSLSTERSLSLRREPVEGLYMLLFQSLRKYKTFSRTTICKLN